MSPSLTPRTLRRIRAGLGVPQQELAALLATSFVSVSRWENGRSSPSGATLDLYLALEAALRRGPAVRRVCGLRKSRSDFLLSLFIYAYDTRAQQKGLDGR